jgi:hypothetical protein
MAQELDCEVSIDARQLSSDELENISDLGQQIKQYINSTRWTSEDFGGDRIKCAMNIFVQGATGEKQYLAQVFIGSQRRIWDLKTKKPIEKSSAIVRIFDDKWEFSYTRGIPLIRNDYRFDPLSSFLDFYSYIIIGLDYDSYGRTAGTRYLQKALDVFNLSRTAGTSKGWEFPGQGTFSRTRFIDDLMNSKFGDFREAFFRYHADGLDRLSTKPDTALARIVRAVMMIGNLKTKVNQQSVLIKTFFDTKYLELCELFLDFKDPDIYRKFSLIDPSHQKSYEEYQQKRK